MNLLTKLLVACACASAVPPALAQSAWPLVRGDALASGVAPAKVSAELELLWKHTLDDSGFEATAVIADGRVCIGDFDGTFHCFQLIDGNTLWNRKFPESGFTEAAALAAGRVIVGDFNGVVRCLSAADGTELWSYQATAESYAAPNIHDGNVLLTTEAGELVALDLKTGDLRWLYRSEAPLRCWPTVVGGRVLLAGCDQRFHAIDIATGTEASGLDIDAQTGSTPAVLDGHVFFGTEQGTFYSIVAKTMDVRWQYRDPKRGQPIRTSAAVERRCVIFASQGKQVTALDPSDGRLLWDFPVRSRVEGSPVIAGDWVFLPTRRGRLVAVDIVSGQEKWQYQAGGAFLASPAIAAGKLVIGNEDGTLYCFGEKEAAPADHATENMLNKRQQREGR